MARRDRIEDPPPANQPGHVPDVVPDKPLVPPPQYRVDGPEVEADTVPPEQDVGLTVRHPFLFESLLVPFVALVGVLPSTTHVTVDPARLEIRFGPWRLVTDIDNVVATEPTGPYAFVKVVGPPHLSLADQGVTFATNRQAGLCIRFRERVRAIAPLGWVTHPAATVTVADPGALARDLKRVGARLEATP